VDLLDLETTGKFDLPKRDP